jgi:hypothetical protein
MNNVITYLYEKLTSGVLASIIIGGGILMYLTGRYFRHRINKQFFNKEKKKIIRRFNLLFNDMTKKASVWNNSTPYGEDKMTKLKIMMEKLKQQDGKEKQTLVNRQDKIFFYIFNNVMLAQKQ